MSNIPLICTVLVIGGGPSGSFAAAMLARDGIDVVLLEAERHPRYHIGESMLPSMKDFLHLIDFYDAFDQRGFVQKNGAAFKLNKSQPPAYTDFIKAQGPGSHSWNVIRSEADEMLFKHAAACGAKAFDGTKVVMIDFLPGDGSDHGRPVSASWAQDNGTLGSVKFEYLVDASGRNGLLSTRYLKNRTFNKSLKNTASWEYWKGGKIYEAESQRFNAPFFEALQDGSGWCWYIPLHDGTHSVGVVQDQAEAVSKKRASGSPSPGQFYMQSLAQAPITRGLLANAERTSETRTASDWSYQAATYHMPYARISGDAGCFIDPFFSSGVHLAISSAISASVTIAASLRGHCEEPKAGAWHTKKVTESYTRFLLVVAGAMQQIRAQEEPIIQDVDETGFHRAFDAFRPVIQGQVDTNRASALTEADVSGAVHFCAKAFAQTTPDEIQAVLAKLQSQSDNHEQGVVASELEGSLSTREKDVIEAVRGRKMLHDQVFNLDGYKRGVLDGFRPSLDRGTLGLIKAQE